MDASARGLRASLDDVLALLFPVSCAGCGEPDEEVCGACLCALAPAPGVRRLPGGLTVHSALPFDGVPARVLRAVKEEGRTALARPLGAALAAALAAAPSPEGARYVPVPSTRAALRRRGYRPVELLLRRAGVVPTRLLRSARRTADQRVLGREERAENVVGSMVATASVAAPILLIDDVVTTGATLLEARRALAEAGLEVLAAVTVASTARRHGGGAGRQDTRMSHSGSVRDSPSIGGYGGWT